MAAYSGCFFEIIRKGRLHSGSLLLVQHSPQPGRLGQHLSMMTGSSPTNSCLKVVVRVRLSIDSLLGPAINEHEALQEWDSGCRFASPSSAPTAAINRFSGSYLPRAAKDCSSARRGGNPSETPSASPGISRRPSPPRDASLALLL